MQTDARPLFFLFKKSYLFVCFLIISLISVIYCLSWSEFLTAHEKNRLLSQVLNSGANEERSGGSS